MLAYLRQTPFLFTPLYTTLSDAWKTITSSRITANNRALPKSAAVYSQARLQHELISFIVTGLICYFVFWAF